MNDKASCLSEKQNVDNHSFLWIKSSEVEKEIISSAWAHRTMKLKCPLCLSAGERKTGWSVPLFVCLSKAGQLSLALCQALS